MNRLLAELRRRNVFRVAAAYLVAGWIVMQVVATIGDAAGLPDWSDSLALVLLVTAFPIVLFIAWAFELTPEGLKKTARPAEPAAFKPLGGTDIVLIGLLAVVIAVAGFQIATRGPAGPPDSDRQAAFGVETGGPEAASIAVLPFADLSPAGDQQYFGDGIAEEILNVLTRVDGLHVASRTSAFQFRGDALGIPAIARELNVRHVVEGSVRKSGETLRITAQLIDSQEDRHLWSDTFDRPLTAENIFAIQDEISREIVAALSETLGITTADIQVDAGTEDLDAYELFLQGQAIFHVRSGDNLPEGVNLLERAVAADPDFARAWATLAAMYSVIPTWINVSDLGRDFDQLSEDAANRATALNDQLALPYSIRGRNASGRFEWDTAIGESNTAVEREPHSANARYFRGGVWLMTGYFDQAANDFEACLERDPAYAICRRHLAITELYRGNTRRGIALFEQGILDRQRSVDILIPAVYFAIGDERAGLLSIAYNLPPDFQYLIEPLYRFHTDFSLSNEALDEAVLTAYRAEYGPEGEPFDIDFDFSEGRRLASSHILLWSPFEPGRFRPARRDAYLAARRDMIIAMGLPEFWRAHGFPPQCQLVVEDDFECGWIDDPEFAQ